MIVVYQVEAWGWANSKTIGLSALAIALLGAFPFVERRAREPLAPSELMRNREFLTLCFCSVIICRLFFIVLLYFTQYAMKFLGDDPMWAGARIVQFMLSYGVVSYFGGMLYGFVGARKLLCIGLICAALASVFLGLVGPGAPWLAFNGSLVLLGVGVGAVIPTVSSRAIEAGWNRSDQPRQWHCFHVPAFRCRPDARGEHGDFLRGKRARLGAFLYSRRDRSCPGPASGG